MWREAKERFLSIFVTIFYSYNDKLNIRIQVFLVVFGKDSIGREAKGRFIFIYFEQYYICVKCIPRRKLQIASFYMGKRKNLFLIAIEIKKMLIAYGAKPFYTI